MNITKKVLMILGTLVLVFFVFVDFLGIGDPGFGYRQIIGVTAGVVLVIIGLALKRKESV
jgi:hypothetical protein